MGMKVRIIADSREFASDVVEELAKHDCTIEQRTLPVGDYLCSDKFVVERKTASDLSSSIIDGRLFEQARKLSEFEKPVIIIEGERLYDRLNPNVIRGALYSLLFDFKIPVVWSRHPRETAGLIHWFAKREQDGKEAAPFPVRTGRKGADAKEQLEYLVHGLPGISIVRARSLLAHFGSAERIFAASEDELKEAKGIGKKTAENIRKLLASKY